MMRERSLTFAFCLALALAAVAAVPAEATGSTLRARLNADIHSTDPGTKRDHNTDGVVMHMVEGLVAFREDTTVGPMLAESWTVSDDGHAYTFSLRKDVKFHNGATMTSDDVVWSLKRYLNPATQWRCLSELDGHGVAKIVAIEASDPHTVVIRLDQPTALFLATIARADCGQTAVLHRDSVGPDGKWVQPIGTGPFKLGEWKRGQYIELLRFDGYVSRSEPRDGYTGAKKVEVEKVRFNFIPDSSAARAGLLSGSLDVIKSLSIPDLDDLKGHPDVQLSIFPAMGVTGILLNTRDPLLSDLRIRRALAISLDTKEMTEALMQGTARPNNSVLPVGSPFHGPVQAEGFKQDIAQARKLLAEAGYKGQPIKMIANKRFSFAFDAAVLVQAMAEAAGIKIEIEVLDWATQLDRYNRGDYQSMTFLYSPRLDPSLSFEMVTGPKATQPRKVWDHPQAQELMRQSMLISDKSRRQALFDELHRMFIADVPMIVLFNQSELAAMRKNVVGYQGWLYALPRFWGVSLK